MLKDLFRFVFWRGPYKECSTDRERELTREMAQLRERLADRDELLIARQRDLDIANSTISVLKANVSELAMVIERNRKRLEAEIAIESAKIAEAAIRTIRATSPG